MSEDLRFLSLAEAGDRLRRKQFSPLELIDAHLDAIAQENPRLNAYLTLCAEEARSGALRATEGGSPLVTIPFGVKDNIDTAGIRTTAASRLLLDNVPTRDAAVLAQLRAGGAVLLGKLNTYEFGTGTGAVYPDLLFPIARNPWNVARFSGGSSTGAGVAVAAGLAMFAIGTDTGGSVRLPAAACGVVGLKPTFGAVATMGMQPNCPSLDHVGPLARTVDDVACVFSAMRRRDLPPLSVGLSPPRLRIGVIRRFHEGDVACEPAIAAGIEMAATMLLEAGAEVIDVTLPYGVLDFRACTRLLNISECFSIHEQVLDDHLDEIGAALRDKLLGGSLIRSADYLRAVRWRRILAASVDVLFDQCDVLLCLGTPLLPPLLSDVGKVTAYTTQSAMAVFSVSGHPALVMSPGFDAQDLPLNVQLAARYHGEETLFAAARLIEAAIGSRRRPDTSRSSRATDVTLVDPLGMDESLTMQRHANADALSLMPRYLPPEMPGSPFESLQ